MSDAYLCQYNDVVVSEADAYDKIDGKYPFHRSTWKNTYAKHMNTQETRGAVLRSTFLSGGSIPCIVSPLHARHRTF